MSTLPVGVPELDPQEQGFYDQGVRTPLYETPLGRLYQGDCLDVLAGFDDGSVDLVFADPPFNLGKDYGKGISDALADEEYLAWCGRWIAACVRVLRTGGAFYLFNLPRWNVELGHRLGREGMQFRHWVAVDIKYSLPIPGRLYPSHYSLLYYTKGKPQFFNRPRVPIPVCRHCGGDLKDYGGHRGKLNPAALPGNAPARMTSWTSTSRTARPTVADRVSARGPQARGAPGPSTYW